MFMRRFLGIFLIVSIFLAGPLLAQNLKTPASVSDMVDIESDRLDVNTKNGTAVFKGRVKATKADIVVKGNVVTLSYDAVTRKVTQMTAEKDAYILWKDREATCNRVMYNLATEVMVLTGDVVMTRGQERISGQKVTLDMKNDSQVVEGGGGRVKVRVDAGKGTGIMQWGK